MHGKRSDTSKRRATRPSAADTRLVTGGRDPQSHLGFVNPPVYHASTVLYPTAADHGRASRRATSTAAAARRPRRRWKTRCSELEGPHCAGVSLLPSGLAAVSTALLSVLSAGDHLLVTDSVYRPTRNFCDTILKRLGVETTYYDPLIGAGIAALFKPNTRAVFVEAPGLADLRDAGHPGDRRGRARQRRGRADGQYLGDAALLSRASTTASISRSRPAPNISAAIPT